MDAATTSSAVPDERFVSRRDGWLVAVLWVASLVDLAVAGWLALALDGPVVWLAPGLAAVGFLQLHALYSTHYTFEGAELVIRAASFRWRVPLAAIDSVEPSRSPRSSPACSLDRLRIRYGARRILVSPDDRTGFRRALAARAPQLAVRGERARRHAPPDADRGRP